ncbi:sulfur carrier protein ThiS [Acetobacteraceae bacterium ESL0709]|nr:sulfur carrier protein ThiS [Acetobacteraceae bacterium ESL0697]MDF7678178.1 sulfur carrier protein ThiS [Acetobacteraceae bacterium ESL0709]
MIRVNGEPHILVSSVSVLLKELGLDKATVATALNGVFVPSAKRDTALLKSGDEVEILAPMQGG